MNVDVDTKVILNEMVMVTVVEIGFGSVNKKSMSSNL